MSQNIFQRNFLILNSKEEWFIKNLTHLNYHVEFYVVFGTKGRGGKGLFFRCLVGWRKEKTNQIISTGPTFSFLFLRRPGWPFLIRPNWAEMERGVMGRFRRNNNVICRSRYFLIILLKNFHLFKITESVINFCLKNFLTNNFKQVKIF